MGNYNNVMVESFSNLKGTSPKKWEIPSPSYIRKFYHAHPESGILVEIGYGLVKFTNKLNFKQGVEIKKMFRKLNFQAGINRLPTATFIISVGDTDYYNWRNTIKNGIWLNSSEFMNDDPTSKLKPILHPLWYFITKSHREQITERTQWKDKMGRVIWRGSTTGGEINKMNLRGPNRKFLVEFSNRFPELVDAKFTNFCDGGIELNKIYKKADPLSPEEQQNYKYIVNIDGHGASYGLYWQISSGSHVIRWSNHRQWFDPYFKGTMTEIEYPEELLKTIKNIDPGSSKRKSVVSKTISDRVFSDEFVLAYLYELLKEYSSEQQQQQQRRQR
jgi:hypothetical protein